MAPCVSRRRTAHSPNIFTEKDWDEAIDFVATKLKPYGYDMLVTDGFAAMGGDDGYMDALQPLSEG